MLYNTLRQAFTQDKMKNIYSMDLKLAETANSGPLYTEFAKSLFCLVLLLFEYGLIN